jgi:hypothetical protein
MSKLEEEVFSIENDNRKIEYINQHFFLVKKMKTGTLKNLLSQADSSMLLDEEIINIISADLEIFKVFSKTYMKELIRLYFKEIQDNKFEISEKNLEHFLSSVILLLNPRYS